MPLSLRGRLQNQRRHELGQPRMFVDRHERHVCRSRMLSLSAHGILGIDLYAYLHRSMKNAVHLRFQIYNFAEIYWISKINVIHRSRHHIAVGMPVRRERRTHTPPPPLSPAPPEPTPNSPPSNMIPGPPPPRNPPPAEPTHLL